MFDLKTVLLAGILVTLPISMSVSAEPADLDVGTEQCESQEFLMGDIVSWVESVLVEISAVWQKAGGLIDPFGDEEPAAAGADQGQPAAAIHEEPELESTQGGLIEPWG